MEAIIYKGYQIQDGDCYYPFWENFRYMFNDINDCDAPYLYAKTVEACKEQIDEILTEREEGGKTKDNR